jgi:hypothetical protein
MSGGGAAVQALRAPLPEGRADDRYALGSAFIGCTKNLAVGALLGARQPPMEIEFDPERSAKNVELRGLSFDLVADFDFDSALVARDIREDHGEDRFIALGRIGDRLHVVAYTMRGERLRVISFRKANAREVERYEQARP